MRKKKFRSGEIYHIFNKSIANFGIFKDRKNSRRFVEVLEYYNDNSVTESFSDILKKKKYHYQNLLYLKDSALIKFLAYNVMPDHYHLVIKILKDDILSKYINDIENSFTRFFNIKFGRIGPLWQSSFKSVRIRSNEQLLHVTRYVHLNATTAGLVDKPEDWQFSSYKDITTNPYFLEEVLTEISIKDPPTYKKFVEDNIDYQRKLKLIKKLIFE